MNNRSLKNHLYEVNLDQQPGTADEIEQHKSRLRRVYINHLSYILGIIVLGTAVTFRALDLGIDKVPELFHISLYSGLWTGLFAGLMIDGHITRKLKLVITGITVCTFSSLLASMLVMLFLGDPVTWITSINILACALAGMWLLTSYDEILKGFESTQIVDEVQLLYVKKAGKYFQEFNQFNEQIKRQGRFPITAEYWAMRDSIQNKIEVNKSKS